MNAYLLIGGNHTRKSTLLRCLTGCFNRSVRDIELLRGGSVKLYARVAALQASRTEPGEFIAEVAATRCSDVALVLWPEANPLDAKRYPDAAGYIAAFQAAGWKIAKVAVVGAHPLALKLPGVARFSNVLHQPINTSAQLIRSHFGWR
jgi:hypothetical protein